MLKRDVEIGGEYAWQERFFSRSNEYRKVVLLKFLSNPGGKHVLVRDGEGEFETRLDRLIKPWSELESKEKEAEFRTRDDEYQYKQRLAEEKDPVGFRIEEKWKRLQPLRPGRAGVPRVPGSLPIYLSDMADGVLTLKLDAHPIVEDEQFDCHRMLCELVNVCERIREVAREMLPEWEAEAGGDRLGSTAEMVRNRLDSGELPFPSSEIMPVITDDRMSRSRATTEYRTGSAAAGDFMERVADDYEELDRYASLAASWGWGFYLRWRRSRRVQ